MLVLLAGRAYATHNQANVSDIDFTGNGVFSGAYTHTNGSSVDHPWFVVEAIAGDILTAQVRGFSGGDSYGWWYQEIDNQIVEVGDTPFGATPDLQLIAQSGAATSYQVVTGPVPATGQYAFQLDSWLGADGNYTVSISGSPGVIPEPSAALLLGLGALGFLSDRRYRA